jgi:hypothetical protein
MGLYRARRGTWRVGPWLTLRTPIRALWIAYHAWTEPIVGYAGGKRSLHLARVGFWLQEIRFCRPETSPAP